MNAGASEVTIVPWIVLQVWIGVSPEAFDLTGHPAVTESYIEKDFEAYYSSREWKRFRGLILPHGLLEISAVIVAGAAGLRIGWSVIAPGDQTRWHALAAQGRDVGNVAIGLVVAFAVAGLIEGFVTGRPWPTSLRVGIGAIAFLAFWGWTIVYGRWADQILQSEAKAAT